MKKVNCIIMDWAGTAVDFGCFAPLHAFLKIFEEKLGFPVFARSKSAILPTERGKIVLETAKQIAKTEQELQDALTSLKQTALQNVRIYIEYTMRNMFLKDIWPKVLQR